MPITTFAKTPATTWHAAGLFARGHDVEEAVLGKFRQQSSAATRPCQVQWKEQKIWTT